MQFSVGQLVVHPHHGPSTIAGISARTVQRVERRYLELRVERTDLTVSVPEERAEELGLRPVFGRAELEQLAAVLGAAGGKQEKQWARRMKDNQAKILSGNLMLTAEVVRDLLRREQDGGISVAERDMLRQARRPILGELAESMSLTDAAAEALLEGLVMGREVELATQPCREAVATA